MSQRVLTLLHAVALTFVIGTTGSPASASPTSSGSGFGPSVGGGPESGRESFKTDQFTGAAALSIPIVVPPGSGGFQPELVLQYSSQRGNSWLGQGWDLVLLSVVRMSKFGISKYDPAFSDNPVSGSAFAIGDDRLVRDDAGVYHTRRESFQRIERVDKTDATIDYWIVRQPTGTTLWFGSDTDPTDSRILHPSGLTAQWLLHRAEDRNGNFISYDYDTSDPGTAYPATITYGCKLTHADCSSTTRSVEFVLSPPQGQTGARTDPSLSYRHGIPSNLSRRLEQIVTKTQAAVSTTYDLVYHGEEGSALPATRRSLLYEIRRLGSGGQVLHGDRYTYSSTAPTWTRDTALEAQLAALEPFPTGPLAGLHTGLSFREEKSGNETIAARSTLLDIDGDGATDILIARWESGATSGSSFVNARERVGAGGIEFFPRDGSSAASVATQDAPSNSFNPLRPRRYPDRGSHFVDVNGDDRPDIIGREGEVTSPPLPAIHNLPAVNVTNYINNGYRWSLASAPSDPYFQLPPAVFTRLVDTRCAGSPPIEVTQLLDVNGDGRADLLDQYIVGHTNCAQIYNLANWQTEVFLNTGSGWTSSSDPAWNTALDSALTTLGVSLDQLVVVDVNGDGLVDLARDADGDGALDPVLPPVLLSPRVMVHSGAGWVSAGDVGIALPDNFRPIDLNGDGLVDQGSSPQQLGAGMGFVSAGFAPPSFAADGVNPALFEAAADVNGDGIVDFLKADAGVVEAWLSSSASGPSGLLVRVEQPEGALIDISYRATTETRCVQPDPYGCNHRSVAALLSSACPYPLYSLAGDPSGTCRIDVQGLPFPIESVAAVTVDDRNGNVRTDQVRRGLGLYDIAAREFRGFGRVLESPDAPPDYLSPSGTGELVKLKVLRETVFTQLSFLPGERVLSHVVQSDDDVIDLAAGSPDRLLSQTESSFLMTRADLAGTFLINLAWTSICDPDISLLSNPGSCDISTLDENQPLTPGLPALPGPLPFAGFRGAFSSANTDESRAYLVLPVRAETSTFDGAEVVARSRSVLYDRYGNQQYAIELATGVDNLYVTSEFATPTCSAPDCGPSYLRSLPMRVQSYAATDPAVRRTAFFYDGLALGSATRGNLALRVDGLTGEEVAVAKTYPNSANGRPTTGLPGSQADPFFSGTSTLRISYTEHDPSGTFATSSTRGTLTTTTTYDPPGAPPGLGIPYRVQGPNGLLSETFADVFGRPTSKAGPSPIGTWQSLFYYDVPRWDAGWSAARARRAALTRDGSGNETVDETYLDGLARPIASRVTAYAEGTGPGQNGGLGCVVSRASYDLLGRVTTAGAPHFEPTPGCDPTPGEAPFSQPLAAEPGNNTFTEMRYDAHGRLRFSIQRNEGVQETRYAGLVTTSIDPEGRVTVTEQNGAGSVVAVTEDASGAVGATPGTTRYRYDLLQQLRGICDAAVAAQDCPTVITSQPNASHTTQIFYDSLGRRTRIEDPDMGPWDFAFDGAGNLVRRTDARGETLHLVYDDVYGRLKCEKAGGAPISAAQCTEPAQGADVVYAYGDEQGYVPPLGSAPLGRLVSAALPEGILAYTYDAPGRITQKTLDLPGNAPSYSISWTHNWLGQPLTTAYPDGEVVTSLYDQRGIDALLSSARTYVSDVQYNAESQPSAVQYGNSTARALAYWPSGLLQSIADHPSNPANPFLSRVLGYDLTGRVTSVEDSADAESLASGLYDGRGRLLSIVRGPTTQAPVTLTYGYDRLGNLISKENVAISYQHSKPHAVYDAQIPGRWQYDPNGNLTTRNGRTLTYDARSRLRSVSGPENATFGYDHSGERIRLQKGAALSHFLTPDYEIQSVRQPNGQVRYGLRFTKTIRLNGTIVARVSTGAPGQLVGTPLALPLGRPWVGGLGLASGATLGLVLLALLLDRQRRGLSLTRPALAGSTALLVLLTPYSIALAQIPMGDLNGDERLDAGDALLESRIVSGSHAPTPAQSRDGDVAPLEQAPDQSINSGDAVLLLRAVGGADVDADGVPANQELAAGASPFRADSDRDGVNDAAEIQAGTDPGDSDQDGIPDNEETGTNPQDPDVDLDGFVDGDETASTRTVAAGDQAHWVHADWLGGATVLTNEAGQVVRRLRYGIWGEIRSNVLEGGAPAGTLDPREKFTGQRFDSDSGLYYYGARYYDPTIGRFIQPDSVVPGPFDPQAHNRYAYVRNDPLTQVDPTGHFWDEFSGGVSDFFGGVGGFVDDYFVEPVTSFGSGLGGGFWDTATGSGVPGYQGAGRVGAEIGALAAAPIHFLASPIQQFASAYSNATGDPVGDDTAAQLARNGLYVGGILTSLEGEQAQASTEISRTGVLVRRPSFGLFNDLLDSAIEKFLPGFSADSRYLARILRGGGHVETAVGFSQGSLLLANAALLAGGSDARFGQLRLEGAPMHAGLTKLMLGGNVAFNEGRGGPFGNQTRYFDLVAALGNPLYLPTAVIGSVASRRLYHSPDLYQEE